MGPMEVAYGWIAFHFLGRVEGLDRKGIGADLGEEK